MRENTQGMNHLEPQKDLDNVNLIGQKLDSLDKALHHLFEKQAALIDRLAPALGPDTPHGTDDKATEPTPRSQYSESINGMTNQIYREAENLTYIMLRLEI